MAGPSAGILRTTLLATLGAAALLASAPGSARAQTTLGITVPSVNNWLNDHGYTLGYQFDAITDLYVTSLGYFDLGGDGLAVSHDVGLWAADGTLITSTTVAAGTSNTLNGLFRMAVLSTPVILTAGTGYTVGGSSTGDPYSIGFYGAHTPHPDITNVSGRWIHSSLSRPVNAQNTVYFAGNFGADPMPVTATPEPVSILLMGTGLAGIAAVRRRLSMRVKPSALSRLEL